MVGRAVSGVRPRGIWWWLAFALAPLGVIGGAIEIVSIFSGVIEWHGWIGYVEEFWTENIGSKFDTLFRAIASILTLPTPPEWLLNYLTLGVLFVSAGARAAYTLTDTREDESNIAVPHRKARLIEVPMNVLGGLIGLAALVLLVVFYVLIWPLLFIMTLGATFMRLPSPDRNYFLRRHAEFGLPVMKVGALLVLSPFAIFLALWGLNYLS